MNIFGLLPDLLLLDSGLSALTALCMDSSKLNVLLDALWRQWAIWGTPWSEEMFAVLGFIDLEASS